MIKSTFQKTRRDSARLSEIGRIGISRAINTNTYHQFLESLPQKDQELVSNWQNWFSDLPIRYQKLIGQEESPVPEELEGWVTKKTAEKLSILCLKAYDFSGKATKVSEAKPPKPQKPIQLELQLGF